jgi:hypothetical protein
VTAQLFEIAIAAFQRRRPFLPFIIELNSGRRLRITHPEAIHTRRGLARYLSAGEQAHNYVFDHHCVCLVTDDEEG